MDGEREETDLKLLRSLKLDSERTSEEKDYRSDQGIRHK